MNYAKLAHKPRITGKDSTTELHIFAKYKKTTENWIVKVGNQCNFIINIVKCSYRPCNFDATF